MVGFTYGKALTMLIKESFLASYLISKALVVVVAKHTLLVDEPC